jgi:hypothetical protein
VNCDACGSAPRAEGRFCTHSGARLDASAGASVAIRGDGPAAGLMNVPVHPPTEVVPNVPSAQVVRSPPSSAFGGVLLGAA